MFWFKNCNSKHVELGANRLVKTDRKSTDSLSVQPNGNYFDLSEIQVEQHSLPLSMPWKNLVPVEAFWPSLIAEPQRGGAEV